MKINKIRILESKEKLNYSKEQLMGLQRRSMKDKEIIRIMKSLAKM